jgi:hypothetical protein
MAGMEQQIGDRRVQPWGDRPPPAPATATRTERRKVRSAWSSWGSFRPWYARDGKVVEAEIDLKDNVWRGTGTGPTEAEAAWSALQDCIDNWRADIAAHSMRRSVRDWWHRPR